MKKIRKISSTLAVAVLTLIFSHSANAQNAGYEVEISGSGDAYEDYYTQFMPTELMLGFFKFKPKLITLKAGQQITWTNKSFAAHTVTADPRIAKDPASVILPPGAQPFNSGSFSLGQKYTHIFTVPGDYKYFCIPHELHGMVGYIHVEP
jgi:plastocyanin